MSKSSAPGMALQRFIECTLCEIADGFLGAMAIVDPQNGHRSDDTSHPVRQIDVSFDLAVAGDAGGGATVHVLGSADDGMPASASRVRFSLPLTLPPPSVAVVQVRPRPDYREPEPAYRDRDEDPANIILL